MNDNEVVKDIRMKQRLYELGILLICDNSCKGLLPILTREKLNMIIDHLKKNKQSVVKLFCMANLEWTYLFKNCYHEDMNQVMATHISNKLKKSHDVQLPSSWLHELEQDELEQDEYDFKQDIEEAMNAHQEEDIEIKNKEEIQTITDYKLGRNLNNDIIFHEGIAKDDTLVPLINQSYNTYNHSHQTNHPPIIILDDNKHSAENKFLHSENLCNESIIRINLSNTGMSNFAHQIRAQLNHAKDKRNCNNIQLIFIGNNNYKNTINKHNNNIYIFHGYAKNLSSKHREVIQKLIDDQIIGGNYSQTVTISNGETYKDFKNNQKQNNHKIYEVPYAIRPAAFNNNIYCSNVKLRMSKRNVDKVKNGIYVIKQ